MTSLFLYQHLVATFSLPDFHGLYYSDLHTSGFQLGLGGHLESDQSIGGFFFFKDKVIVPLAFF